MKVEELQSESYLREKRIAVVNRLIEEIANRGRKFFAYEGNIATMYMKGSKVYMKNEYNGIEMCLSIPDYRKPKGWTHGGTLMGLVRDFKEYILNGGDTNHNNGYGGLYCPHWGYPDEDMEAIQQLGRELGYLMPKEVYFGKHLSPKPN